MWSDPQKGRVVSDAELREFVGRISDRIATIVAGTTFDAIDREIAAEFRALAELPHEPAILIVASHEAGPGMMDLWARVLDLTDSDETLRGRVLDHVDRAVEWQARDTRRAA